MNWMSEPQPLVTHGRSHSGNAKVDKTKEGSQRLHEGCKALKAQWKKFLQEQQQTLKENEFKEYKKSLQRSPKFQMIEHLVKQSKKEKHSILVFVGACCPCFCLYVSLAVIPDHIPFQPKQFIPTLM